MRPAAREEDLLVEIVDGEAIIYDLRSNDVHHLDERALAIWRACDGRTTIQQIANASVDAGSVEPTLRALDAAGLLEQVGELRSRRQLLVAGGVAAAMPIVATVAAPTPAMAASPKPCTKGTRGCVPGVADMGCEWTFVATCIVCTAGPEDPGKWTCGQSLPASNPPARCRADPKTGLCQNTS
ncbi:MAG TPA: PqqD family protein [Solirubrobacteraceae bacterium]|jgi:hypothetical protein|nr:PqqD family protein [Solirubrobacteraceae bacterium]